MTKEELLKDHTDIFDNLDEYALIKVSEGTNSFYYNIIYKPTMAFVLIEEYAEDVRKLMMDRGVQIVNHNDEIRPVKLSPAHVIWDEEKQEWRKIYGDEIVKIAEERRKSKDK